MTSQADRRRFLKAAGTGIATGLAASAGVTALRADDVPPVPLPDADTKAPVPGTGTQPADCSTTCNPASTLIFACSGAADVGGIADQAARKLTKDGVGKMFCLAGVGGRVEGIMKGARAAETILAIDGCPLQCTRNCLEKAGFKQFKHVCLADLGMARGETPITKEVVANAAATGKRALGG